MAKFIKGDIVVVPFLFSDLTNAKRRPAFVLAVLPGDDIILCQITSRDTKDEFAIKVKRVLDKLSSHDNMSLLPVIVELAAKVDRLEKAAAG